ncbi:MAG: DUF721 domain-containing protein [Bryobacterales bacterium]|nr:DUF721 domain-containing protein [Bryobacterales bacterium]
MEQAKSILPRLFQGAPDTVRWQLDLIRAYWPEAVGPLLASHSDPVRVRPPTLFVQVSDAAWLEEFRPMRQQIVSLLQQEMGSRAVTRIEFQLEGAEEPARPHEPTPRRQQKGPARRRRKS